MQIEQIILTLAGSIIAAYVTVRLSLRRFRAERLWVRRVDAYQTVLLALHQVSRHLAAEFAIQAASDPQEQSKVQRQKTGEAYAEIEKAIVLGCFLMSDDAVTCLEELMKSSEETNNFHKENYLGALIDSQGEVNDCIKSLRVIAKEDIKE